MKIIDTVQDYRKGMDYGGSINGIQFTVTIYEGISLLPGLSITNPPEGAEVRGLREAEVC
jgi:hypothetical protein